MGTSSDISTWENFWHWEKSTYDTVDVKRVYIYLAGDLTAGVVLSQILYWFVPNSRDKLKLRITKEGLYWLAQPRSYWKEQFGLSSSQVGRAFRILKERELIVTRIYKFNAAPTTHIGFHQNFFPLLTNALNSGRDFTKTAGQFGKNGKSITQDY